MASEPRLSGADFAWILGSLCQLHRKPFDATLLLQQFPPPYNRNAILSAAKALDFKAGPRRIAEIHLGTRTVMEYLFSPVSKAFHEAARER